MSVPRYWRKQQNRYNLKGNKCETCGRYFFPPRAFCPECRRDGKIVDYEFSGNGTVRTFSVIRTASDDYDIQTPYVIAIIELEEGTCMTAQVICEPDEISIGMPVKSVFRKIIADGDSGVIVYGTKFVPA
ncbi:Zn-ribbon domain-containing OB-fold protein [Methanogenium organophilum]|uniref:Zn-ribbon domain-containing OB-fold protein n=1 Tax=Methanogenium organophilum TaxID=2199 RepID=A0A9X9S3V1_METOG|nr:Zn-ribbon domain-containing OB-fold protein [Methanogenium organophilum]WAI00410.1 Zn-ribbon domain-containing OB-fold protein [Methanogenium organophilum]